MPDQWSFRTYMVYVYPVLDVSKYCHGFMNRIGYYYRMSTSYYYSYGDGDSIIVEINEQPQGFISIPKFDEVDFVENDEPQESSYSGGLLIIPCIEVHCTCILLIIKVNRYTSIFKAVSFL